MPHKDPDVRRAYNNAWRSKNRDSANTAGIRYRSNRRLSAIAKLGGSCVSCGNDDIGVLEFDHVNGGGTKERATKSGWQYSVQNSIINNARSDIQLLCANCHSIKTWHTERES